MKQISTLTGFIIIAAEIIIIFGGVFGYKYYFEHLKLTELSVKFIN
jgi:uncharacterized membrane protein YpjA